ncbi:MAG: DeoR/GlpR family DNA-binding transcription regulator [Opitutaceae bacterium]
MFAQERQHKITELLEQRRKIGVYDLQQLLGVSPATLRRDLAQLQRIGKLVRTHGGVLHTNFRTGEPAFERKVREAAAAKNRIAEVAARLVPPNATVFVDAGTTTLEVGRRLLGRDDLTIFTNSLPLLNERRTGKSALVSIGGEMREISRALVGSVALDWLRRLRLDLAFIGASGLDTDDGASTTELMEAAVKKGIVTRSRRTVLVADSSKWDKPAPILFAGWRDFSDFVTDQRPSRARSETLQRHRVHWHAPAA